MDFYTLITSVLMFVGAFILGYAVHTAHGARFKTRLNNAVKKFPWSFVGFIFGLISLQLNTLIPSMASSYSGTQAGVRIASTGAGVFGLFAFFGLGGAIVFFFKVILNK